MEIFRLQLSFRCSLQNVEFQKLLICYDGDAREGNSRASCSLESVRDFHASDLARATEKVDERQATEVTCALFLKPLL